MYTVYRPSVFNVLHKRLADRWKINYIPTRENCRAFTLVGLFLTSVGAGGVKPCISSFGGDQFVLPDQEDLLQKFFSWFYFAVNAGSLFTSFITPELRKSVQCFGKDSCFPLAFGVPALLMSMSIGEYN